MPRTVLCLDVGLANTGWAVYRPDLRRFVKAGCISTSPVPKKTRTVYKNVDDARRYTELSRGVNRLISRWSPMLIAAEMPSGGAKSQSAATGMAAAAAIVSSVATVRGVLVKIVQPSQTKHLIRPEGKVSKEDVIAYVSKRYGSGLIPDDAKAEHVADAMACIAVLAKG